jgi:hypothetical protein
MVHTDGNVRTCSLKCSTTAYLINKFLHISVYIKSSVTERAAWFWLLQFLDVMAKHVFR